VLQEIEDVLSRADVLQKLRLSFIEARALVTLLQRQGLFIEPATTIRRSRDPGDDTFLECAVGGQADYIVTADNDPTCSAWTRSRTSRSWTFRCFGGR
jgi:putative PIN family toxin of toxin-antitoxin system